MFGIFSKKNVDVITSCQFLHEIHNQENGDYSRVANLYTYDYKNTIVAKNDPRSFKASDAINLFNRGQIFNYTMLVCLDVYVTSSPKVHGVYSFPEVFNKYSKPIEEQLITKSLLPPNSVMGSMKYTGLDEHEAKIDSEIQEVIYDFESHANFADFVKKEYLFYIDWLNDNNPDDGVKNRAVELTIACLLIRSGYINSILDFMILRCFIDQYGTDKIPYYAYYNTRNSLKFDAYFIEEELDVLGLQRPKDVSAVCKELITQTKSNLTEGVWKNTDNDLTANILSKALGTQITPPFHGIYQ